MYRKITDEIHQLSEELRQDQAAWKNVDVARKAMEEKWFREVQKEEEHHIQRMSQLDTTDKEQRLDALKSIADGTFPYELAYEFHYF